MKRGRGAPVGPFLLALFLGALPPALQGYGLPMLWITEETELDSEELIAYELGYRCSPTRTLSLDAALYVNQYDNLRAYRQVSEGIEFAETGDALVYRVMLDNGKEGHSYGAELSAT